MSDTNRTPTSVNLRQDLKEWMDRENINRSDLVNELLDAYRNGGGVINRAIADKRRAELDSEIRELQKRLEIKQEEREELSGTLTSTGKPQEEVLQEAADTLSPHQVHEDSGPVEFWSNRAGMTTTEFISEMENRLNE